MFFAVTNALKKRFVVLFQDIFREHPIFDKVQVLTKFPEEERPKYALLIRSASGSSIKLSLDNFVRTEFSYSSLANLKGIYGNSIEWVKDDVENMDNLSAPGFYIVKIVSTNLDTEVFTFTVDPFLLVDDEILTISTHVSGKQMATLKNIPINPGSEAIFSVDDGIQFKKDVDYTINYETGLILFNSSISDFEPIHVDYQLIGDQMGPFEIEYYMLNNVAIPGVILAFGDRLKVNDEQVVIVEKEKRETAKVYGGRWQLSLDLIGISQDTDQQERLVDFAISSFWANWQDRLVEEGINVFDFALSGESEDLEAEIPDEYNYTGGISFTAETDWELHVAMTSEVRKINIGYGSQVFKDSISNLKEAQYEANEFDLRMKNAKHQTGLQAVTLLDPIVISPSPIVRKTLKYRTS